MAQDNNANDAVIDVTRRNTENMIQMRGTVLRKEARFSDPAIARIFARHYPYINSRLYIIQVFGPNVVPMETVSQCTEIIENLLTKDTKKVLNNIEQISTLITANMGTVGEQHNPSMVKFLVNARLSNVLYKYFELCDKYIGLISSAWLDGLISDGEKTKALDKIRANVRSITATTNINSNRIFNMLKAARNDAAKAIENAKKPDAGNADIQKLVDDTVSKSKAASKEPGKNVLDGDDGSNDHDDTPVNVDITNDDTVVNASKEFEGATS